MSTPDSTFAEGHWTVTRHGARVFVRHTDTDIEVDVDENEMEVFAEGGSNWDRYAIRVYMPLTVLRAILDAVDAAKESA